MRDLTKTLSSRDWAPLFAAFAEVLEWLLDRAQLFAREYPEEVAAVERIRTFTRRRAVGDPAHARIDDLLFTLGLIAGAIEEQRQLDRATAARAAAARASRAELAASHESRDASRAELAACPESRDASRAELAASADTREERTEIGAPPLAASDSEDRTVIGSPPLAPAEAPSPHPRVFARGTARLPTKRAPHGASPAVRIRRPS